MSISCMLVLFTILLSFSRSAMFFIDSYVLHCGKFLQPIFEFTKSPFSLIYYLIESLDLNFNKKCADVFISWILHGYISNLLLCYHS